ncbi:hypothetical protein HPY86_04670 [candidate division WOR-3 bacterium]|nr:hypothetical protein [candidate division WOR-3 bacterium]
MVVRSTRTGPTTYKGADLTATEEQISWKVHRAKEMPVRTVLVGIFIIAFLVFTLLAFGFLLFGVAVVVLFGATHTYFLPVRYTLSSQGVTVDKGIFSYTYEWSRFRRFFLTSGGVVLSPFPKQNFLDNFRGVHLLLPAEATPILDYLKNRFARADDVS